MAGTAYDWFACERIADLPAVHEALQGFTQDPTGDNGTYIVRAVLEAVTGQTIPAPIPMILYCPKCGVQHIDAPETHEVTIAEGGVAELLDWANPPHRSHLCHGCGHIWRPADVPTEGVASIQTRGKNDSPATDRVHPDTRRLDFIIEHRTSWYPGYYNGAWQKDQARGTLCYENGTLTRGEVEGATMREAIDAARSAK